jgi:hypothetical protein
MTRALAIAMLSIVMLPAAALGQHQGTPEQQRACRHDATRFCRAEVDDFAVANCLRANIGRLRTGCREIIEGRR